MSYKLTFGIVISVGALLGGCSDKKRSTTSPAPQVRSAVKPSPSTSADADSASTPSSAPDTANPDPASISQVAVAAFPIKTGDATCPDGGQVVISYLDRDGSGIYDPSGLLKSYSVCNGPQGLDGIDGQNGKDGVVGAAGKDGSKAVVTQTSIPVGSTLCAGGGQKVSSFIDVANTGIYNSSVDTNYQETVFCNSLAQLAHADQDSIDLANKILNLASINYSQAGALDAKAQAALTAAKAALNAAKLLQTPDVPLGVAPPQQAPILLTASTEAADAAILETDRAILAAAAASLDISSLDPTSTFSLSSVVDVQSLIVLNAIALASTQGIFAADTEAVSLADQVAAVNSDLDALNADLATDPGLAAVLTAPVLASFRTQLSLRASSKVNSYRDDIALIQDAINALVNPSNATSSDLIQLQNDEAVADATMTDMEAIARYKALDTALIGYKALLSKVNVEVANVAVEQAQLDAAASTQAQAVAQNALAQAQALADAKAAQLQKDTAAFQAAQDQAAAAAFTQYLSAPAAPAN